MARIAVNNMAVGRYFIGDPRLVLSDENWDALFREYSEHRVYDIALGRYRLAVFEVPRSDTFEDEEDNAYVVGSGLIAAVPAELAVNPDRFYFGQEFLFTAPFHCSIDYPHPKNVRFGRVNIELC